MDFDALLGRMFAPSEAVLRRLLQLPQDHPWPETAAVPAGMPLLQEMVDAQLDAGGKRLRAVLTPALVAAGQGPQDAALVFGAAVELLHNGTLVHDDIQDGDQLRRGRPTLWTVYGTPQAINAGDGLLMGALAAVLQAPEIKESLRAPLANLLASALFETIRGQVADLALRDLDPITADDLLAVHIAKTGPLFAACLQGAVLLLDGSAEQMAAAKKLGGVLGVAFQVRDDLLDLRGTKGRGAAGADLREGKVTYPLLCALQRATPADVAALRLLLTAAAAGGPPPPDRVAWWVAWTEANGGGADAEVFLQQSLQQARVLAEQAFGADVVPVAHALADRLAQLDG
jgi:geranylgeranyl pyrophosphate synthase